MGGSSNLFQLFNVSVSLHSHFDRGGRGVARPSILTSIVVAAEWPSPAFSLLSWWPRSGTAQHSHFYRGGRGVARPNILTSIVAGRNCPKRSASSTNHINFNKMVFVLKHFTFIFRFEAVFIFPSWFHWIQKNKKNELRASTLWRILIAGGFG
jgi:hypothetical protein